MTAGLEVEVVRREQGVCLPREREDVGDGAARGHVCIVYVIFSTKLGNLERRHQTRKPKN